MVEEVVPAKAKKPQDRKPKAVAVGESIRVEVRGVEVEVDRAVLNDWRFLEDMAVAEAGDEESLFPAIRVLRRLAGESWAELRNDAIEAAGGSLTGVQGVEALLPLIGEIFEALGDKEIELPN